LAPALALISDAACDLGAFARQLPHAGMEKSSAQGWQPPRSKCNP